MHPLKVFLLGGASQTVESCENEHTYTSSDQGIAQQRHREERGRMIQQNALRYCKNNLMKMKKYENQSKAAGRMFGVNASSHGGSKISTSVLAIP